MLAVVQPATAARPLVTVSGHITAIFGRDRLDVEGRAYKVQDGSPAADSLRQFSIGQVVDVSLDGELSDPASRVVLIRLHQVN